MATDNTAERSVADDATAGPVQDRSALVASAWADHLGAAAASPDTNFFEAGGNSLLAASMMGRLSDEFERGLPMRLLVRNPTLQRLSEAISTLLATPAESGPAADRARSWD